MNARQSGIHGVIDEAPEYASLGIREEFTRLSEVVISWLPSAGIDDTAWTQAISSNHVLEVVDDESEFVIDKAA